MRISSAVSDAQKQLNITERELSELPQKIRAATDNLDFDTARKLKRRKLELEERQPRQLAVVLRLKYNEAESKVERLRHEVSERKRLQLEAQAYSTRYFDLYQQANKVFNLSALNVAQEEAQLAEASRDLIEVGRELEALLGRLAA